MPAAPPDERLSLKPWHMALGSVVILLHLAAVAVCGFMMLSGPWPTPMGDSPALPPQFAQTAYRAAGPVYAQGLRIGANSRYMTNRPGMQPAIQFEVLLKDDKGALVKRLKFPDPEANFWVRHRQDVLALWLGNDGMMQPLEGEIIAAPGQKLERRTVWRELSPMAMQGSRWHIRDKDKKPLFPEPRELNQVREMWERKQLDLTYEVSENQVDWEPAEMLHQLFMVTPTSNRKLWLVRREVNSLPRGMPMPQPNDWTMLVVKAYGRYLCRTHNAASAELVRVSQPGYPPVVLFGDVPADPFKRLESYFGKVAP